MKNINNYIICVICALFCGCAPHSILKRHYRQGFYKSKQSNTTLIACADKQSITLKSNSLSNKKSISENCITDVKTIPSSIDETIKKDSIIIYKIKGEKAVKQVFKTNHDYDVIVTKKADTVVKVRQTPPVRKNLVAKFKKQVLTALIFSAIPVLGIILSTHAHNDKKDLLEFGETTVVEENKKRLNLALFISIAEIVLVALLVLTLLLGLAGLLVFV